MAKPLVFQLGDTELSFSLGKVDRSKLYGYKEVEVLDTRNRGCELATLADDGKTVIGKGGTGLAYISAEGEWADKASLKPIDLEGNEIHPVGSSFSAPIKLFDTVTADEYMQHNIRLVYKLESDDAIEDLLAELKDGTIFSFPYSYRGGLEADCGFLLMNGDDTVFLAVGNPTKVEFIGLQEVGAVVAEEESEDDEGDMMDFDMI